MVPPTTSGRPHVTRKIKPAVASCCNHVFTQSSAAKPKITATVPIGIRAYSTKTWWKLRHPGQNATENSQQNNRPMLCSVAALYLETPMMLWFAAKLVGYAALTALVGLCFAELNPIFLRLPGFCFHRGLFGPPFSWFSAGAFWAACTRLTSRTRPSCGQKLTSTNDC
jgi:hypothetical protein